MHAHGPLPDVNCEPDTDTDRAQDIAKGENVLVSGVFGSDMRAKTERQDEGGVDTNGDEGHSSLPVDLETLEKEMNTLVKLRHPNIINYIGACRSAPNVAIVMEYAEYGSLDTVLYRRQIDMDRDLQLRLVRPIRRCLLIDPAFTCSNSVYFILAGF